MPRKSSLAPLVKRLKYPRMPSVTPEEADRVLEALAELARALI